MIKLGRVTEWRRRRYAWAAVPTAVCWAMLMIDDYDAWWHFPFSLLRAVPTGIAIAILGPALTPRRIMLDAEKLRLSDGTRTNLPTAIPRRQVLGAELVERDGAHLRLRVSPRVWGSGAIDVDARDPAAAYRMIWVWIGGGEGHDRARRLLLKRLSNAMSVSARGPVGGAD